MPKEKFYPQTAVEGTPGDLLELVWLRDKRGVYLAMLVDGSWSFIDLDRSGLNRLIRALRRARDQTFGSDE